MTNDSHDHVSRAATPTLLSKGFWIVGLGLLANAGVMLYSHIAGRAPDLLLDRAAFAQADPGAVSTGQPLGARGLYMMPAQLGANAWGVYLMDVDSQTLCVYRTTPETNRFRLMAARSFKNDRFLEDYDNEGLLPKDVQKMVSNQRQRQNLENQTGQPTVDQTPKPDENAPDAAKNPQP
ncbi:MAG TPA: hypothetical protein VM008_09180 [Phycisphaerae bacterium]|nr:hypothetical protein [Phycisphaerae bacterium]